MDIGFKINYFGSKDSTDSKNSLKNNTNVNNTSQRYLRKNIKEDKISKKKKIIILSSCIAIFILIVVVFVVIYFCTLKKQEQPTEINEISTNRIRATYKLNSGEVLKLLNSKKIESDQYKITLLDDPKSLRSLDTVLTPGSKIDFTGDVNIAIDFNSSLNSLESLFENVTQLKQVNLTDFDTSQVTNMDSMFSGCSSLEDIIFDGIDTRKVNTMKYLFKNCQKLKNVNMSPINSQNIKNMTSIFFGCTNIDFINISSFPKIKDDFLDGLDSKISLISNEKIFDNLKKISLNFINKKISIYINNFNDNDNSCEKGDNEKCKTCSNNIKGNCLFCNDGYFLPINSINRKKCAPCSVKEHCTKCIGLSSFVLCQECEEGYTLKNNICKKTDGSNSEKEEDSCVLGLDEKCTSCSSEEGKKNQCDKCNDGYYLPSDKNDNLKCESCKKIKNCASCSGSLNSPKCDKCETGFKLINNECKEILCERGMNEKCLHCNMEKDKKEECLTCNDGYFIPDDAQDKTKCVKCSLEGCKTCSGTIGKEKCIQCLNYPFIINGEIKTCNDCKIGSGANCLSCDKNNKCEKCNKGYILIDGKCKLIENTFHAVYNSTTVDEPTKIMCNYHTKFKLTDFQMYVNGELVIPSIIDLGNSPLPFIVYKFKYIGLQNVTVSFNTTLKYCIGWMFGECPNLISVKFSKTFDTSYVTSIYNMFVGDENLVSIDMSSFDTSRINDMTDTFYSCKSLTSLDLSNFNTNNVARMEGMFDYCESLNYIDLSSFNMTKVKNTESMFSYVSKTGTIKISNLFGDYKKLIPKNWTIIN